MLNYIWIGMILIGIVGGALLGNTNQVALAFVDSSKEAIELCVVMLGVVGMWTGIMKIAEKSGVAKSLSKAMGPVLSFLFPKLKKDGAAREYIAQNMAANVLGLGWAATPAGLKAMDELKKISKNNVATNEMCTFLVINISSPQLIPVNIIAYRSQYGAVNPTDIILPSIIATFVSTLVGIIYCVIACRICKEEE